MRLWEFLIKNSFLLTKNNIFSIIRLELGEYIMVKKETKKSDIVARIIGIIIGIIIVLGISYALFQITLKIQKFIYM